MHSEDRHDLYFGVRTHEDITIQQAYRDMHATGAGDGANRVHEDGSRGNARTISRSGNSRRSATDERERRRSFG